MEHQRQTLSSGYSSLPLHLDEQGELSRLRQALSESAGNAQPHNLASIGSYHDSKLHQPRLERPMYSMRTVPSQPSRQPVADTLELRRQHTRRRRALRYSRNPIVDSPQYQAYRARQNRDGNGEDSKWPEILEIAFLDGKGCFTHHLNCC
jgi:transcriptional enhancer factor